MAQVLNGRLSMTLLLSCFILARIDVIGKAHSKSFKYLEECFEIFKFVLSNAVNHPG